MFYHIYLHFCILYAFVFARAIAHNQSSEDKLSVGTQVSCFVKLPYPMSHLDRPKGLLLFI